MLWPKGDLFIGSFKQIATCVGKILLNLRGVNMLL